MKYETVYIINFNMTFLLILLLILVFTTVPCMFQIIWNTSIVSLFNYFGLTVAPVTYGIAMLIWWIWSIFFGKNPTEVKNSEFCKELFIKYISSWMLVGIICLISIIVF